VPDFSGLIWASRPSVVPTDILFNLKPSNHLDLVYTNYSLIGLKLLHDKSVKHQLSIRKLIFHFTFVEKEFYKVPDGYSGEVWVILTY